MSPIRPQRTLLRVREPIPNSGEPATHRRIQVRKMRLAVGNVGRKCAEMRENLVFALGEYGVPELAGARAYGARRVTMAFVAAPLLHGLLNVGLPLWH